MYLFARKHLLSILSSEPLGGVPWNRCSQGLNKILKVTLMQILKSVYVIVFVWKQFRILNPKNSRVIDPWSLFYFLKIRRLFASFCCLYCWSETPLWTVPHCRCSRKTEKFLEKYLWMSSYLSKVSGSRPDTELLRKYFSRIFLNL